MTYVPMNQFLTCEETRPLLKRYLAAATDSRDTQLVAEHLESCAACMQVAMTMAAVAGGSVLGREAER